MSEFIQFFTDNPEFLPALALAFSGFCAAAGKLIGIVAGVTESDKDDSFASGLTRFAAKLKGILDTLGIKP